MIQTYNQNKKILLTTYSSDNESIQESKKDIKNKIQNEKKEYRTISTQTNPIGIIQKIDSEHSYLNKKRNIFNTNIQNLNKNILGRKKKNDITKSKHTKYSYDNCIYKIKNKVINCVVYTLNKLLKNISSQNYEIKKIESVIFKDGTKCFNLLLLKKKIKEILLLNISPRYSNKFNNNNKFIIEKFSSNNLFSEILNMSFEDCINNLFMMSSNDFETKYSFENKLLFDEIEIKDNQEKKILRKLIEDGLTNYFQTIKSRKIRKEKPFLNISNFKDQFIYS